MLSGIFRVMTKNIALIIAHRGFQPIEYGEPKKVLENAEYQVTTVSDQPGTAVSKFGDKVDVALSVADMNPDDYDGIFLIGGPGALEHLDNETTHAIVRRAAASGKPWGAICIAPRILAHANVLEGKRATGWNIDGELPEILAAAGAAYASEPCVEDGRLITADGPESARLFGEAIVRQLAVVLQK